VVTEARSPAGARVGRPHRLYSKASVRLPVAKRKRFPRVTAVTSCYGDAATSIFTISARMQYCNSVMAAGSNFAFKITGKPLQIEAY